MVWKALGVLKTNRCSPALKLRCLGPQAARPRDFLINQVVDLVVWAYALNVIDVVEQRDIRTAVVHAWVVDALLELEVGSELPGHLFKFIPVNTAGCPTTIKGSASRNQMSRKRVLQLPLCLWKLVGPLNKDVPPLWRRSNVLSPTVRLDQECGNYV